MNSKLVALAATALAMTLAPTLVFAADAPAAAPAAKPAFSVADSTIGDLLDNAATKAVLEKHMAPMVGNPQIDMARSMTLKQIQGFAPGMVTDELLAKVDADLAKITK